MMNYSLILRHYNLHLLDMVATIGIFSCFLLDFFFICGIGWKFLNLLNLFDNFINNLLRTLRNLKTLRKIKKTKKNKR